jgi:hypothetical protein
MNASYPLSKKEYFECKVALLNERADQQARMTVILRLRSFGAQYLVHLRVEAQYLVHLRVKAQNNFTLEPHRLEVVQINLGCSFFYPLAVVQMSLDLDSPCRVDYD